MEDKANLSNFLRAVISCLSRKTIVVLSIVGALLAALGFVFFDLSSSISFIKGHIIIIVVFILVLILSLIDVMYEFYRKFMNIKSASIPRVRRTCPPEVLSPNPDARAVLILDPSNDFHQDDLVSIYYKHDEIEMIIGYGEVINIHEGNKLIQVEIIYISDEDILKNLSNNNNEYLKKVEVRPHISRKKLEEFKLKREQENATRQR